MKRTYTLVSAKSIFKVSLWVVALTILFVFIFGLGSHHTLYENSIISTTILSAAFFVFIAAGLYRGVKLKDDVGDLTSHYKVLDTTELDMSGLKSFGHGWLEIDGDDGCLGVILAIILWIVVGILAVIFIWIFTNVFFFVVLVFAAMLYWVFFRALRLVFRNSNRSKGDLFESLKWAFTYTILYNFWIYGIMYLLHRLPA